MTASGLVHQVYLAGLFQISSLGLMEFMLCSYYTVCVNHARKPTRKNESENIGRVSKTGRFAVQSVAYFSSKIKLIHQAVGKGIMHSATCRRKTPFRGRGPSFCLLIIPLFVSLEIALQTL